jgi:hypothetical protein
VKTDSTGQELIVLLGYLYRLEYGSKERQLQWAPSWPDDILRDDVVGTDVTRRSNMKMIEKTNKKVADKRSTKSFERVSYDRRFPMFEGLWTMFPGGSCIDHGENSLPMRTGWIM